MGYVESINYSITVIAMGPSCELFINQYTWVVRKIRGHSEYWSQYFQFYGIVLICIFKNNLAIHIWIFIPICKFLNTVLNIFMQWGVGHGALRPFPWCFRYYHTFPLRVWNLNTFFKRYFRVISPTRTLSLNRVSAIFFIYFFCITF